MVSFLQQSASVTQTMSWWQKKSASVNTLVVGGIVCSMLSLSACQTAPDSSAAMNTYSNNPIITAASDIDHHCDSGTHR